MRTSDNLTVSKIEQALLTRYPAQDAEPWDRTGMLVGDGGAAVTGIAVALDPCGSAIRRAAELGANVLVAHHPLFIEAPDAIRPASDGIIGPGAWIWEAISQGVSVMSFHTALDVSREAWYLADMLGLPTDNRVALEPHPQAEGPYAEGFGCICTMADENSLTAGELLEKCNLAFDGCYRLHGSPQAVVRKVATWNGGLGDAGRIALKKGVDCVVCGEVKYHEALALQEAGLCVIELGHDVSEKPYIQVLINALSEELGIESETIFALY